MGDEVDAAAGQGRLGGFGRWLFVGITVALCAFLIWTALLGQLPNVPQRSIALSGCLVLGLLALPARAADSRRVPWYDWLLIALVVVASIRLFEVYEGFLRRPGSAGQPDLALGVAVTAVVLEISRRAIGWSFAALVAVFLGYALLGQYLPGRLAHGGLGWWYTVDYMYHTTSGLWGSLTDTFVSLIALFIIFSTVMMHTGAGPAMMDLARAAGGRYRGGAAKIAVVSSAMVGTITGSSVTNVAMTGQFTIPMMKRMGYPPAVAGAIEATASSGGQITPPLMGAGLFLMADLLGMGLVEVMLAALIPAFLFYVGVLGAVHFDSCRDGIGAVAPQDMPSAARLKDPRLWGAVLAPFVVLIGMIVEGYSIEWSVLAALAVVMAVHVAGARSPAELAGRLRDLWNALVETGMPLVTLGVLIAAASVLVGLIELTGVGVKFSELVVAVGQGHTLPTLFLAAVVVLILGMGMPTTAAYVLSTAVIVVALQKLGLSPLQAHMFAFYCATLSALTPPVCAAVFVAAGLANAPWWDVAVQTLRLAVIKYILPFIFALHAPLLMVGDGMTILVTLAFATAGTLGLSAAFSGYAFAPLNGPWRWAMGVASLAILAPEPVSSIIGLTVALAVAWVNWRAADG